MLDRLALAGVLPLKKIHEHCDFSMGCFFVRPGTTTGRLLLIYPSLLLPPWQGVSTGRHPQMRV